MNQIEQLEYVRDEFNKIPNDMFDQVIGYINVDEDIENTSVCVGCHLSVIMKVTGIHKNGIEYYDYELGVEKLAAIMGIYCNDLVYRLQRNGDFSVDPFSVHSGHINYKEVMTNTINERIEELQNEPN